MRLLLIRHGQTPANVIGAIDTLVPGPGLTELGFAQAAAVPAALEGEHIDAIYASILVRTQLTAAPLIADRGLELQIRGGLREVSSGDFEGRTDGPSQQHYLQTMVAWAGGDLERVMPGGETGAEVIARYNEVIAEAHNAGHGAVAIVSHGAVIRTWVGYTARNVSAEFIAQTPLHNTGIVVLEGSPIDGWHAISYMGEALGGAILDDAVGAGPAAEAL